MTHTHPGDGTVPGLHGEPIPTPVLGCPACVTVHSIGDELGATPEGPAPSLTDFLLARIAEDEAAARAAEPGPWRTEKYDANVLLTGERANAAVAIGPWGSDIGDSAVHMVRWDPARVLAECDAKRRIVAQHEIVESGYCEACDHQYDTLRLLALPYADHPDYREEWRP